MAMGLREFSHLIFAQAYTRHISTSFYNGACYYFSQLFGGLSKYVNSGVSLKSSFTLAVSYTDQEPSYVNEQSIRAQAEAWAEDNGPIANFLSAVGLRNYKIDT